MDVTSSMTMSVPVMLVLPYYRGQGDSAPLTARWLHSDRRGNVPRHGCHYSPMP